MREIALTRGRVALVDDEDYARVACYRWHAGAGYAQRSVLVNGKRRTEFMHRFILGAVPGEITDHIDGDGYNNQRTNLRPCTHGENCRNARKQRTGNSSRYKGVCWHKQIGRWVAFICCDNKSEYLGTFTSEVDAAIAYDAAAQRLHGEFARLNYPSNDATQRTLVAHEAA